MLIGLDVGDKRVGVALTDEGGTLAYPYQTWVRAGGEAERKLLALIEEKHPRQLVVGLPLNEQGEEPAQAHKIRRFCERVGKRTTVQIVFVDEYLSSYEASEKLRGGGPADSRWKKRDDRRRVCSYNITAILGAGVTRPRCGFFESRYRSE